MTTLRTALIVSLLAAACGHALAQKSGGSSTPAPDVVALDQVKVTTVGIGGGDTPGFPIHIMQPGSYRLMSNLVVPAGADAIVVGANDVTIDLNGFSISGPGFCNGSGASVMCSAQATKGIWTSDANVQRISVRNGHIGGFGFCLFPNRAAQVADITLRDCSVALAAHEGSMVSKVVMYRVRDAGSLYAASVDGLTLYQAASGFATSGSSLRGIVMNAVHSAFSPGSGANSSLSMSTINASFLGSGVQSVGANLCNGASC